MYNKQCNAHRNKYQRNNNGAALSFATAHQTFQKLELHIHSAVFSSVPVALSGSHNRSFYPVFHLRKEPPRKNIAESERLSASKASNASSASRTSDSKPFSISRHFRRSSLAFASTIFRSSFAISETRLSRSPSSVSILLFTSARRSFLRFTLNYLTIYNPDLSHNILN